MFRDPGIDPHYFTRKVEVKKSNIPDAGLGVFATDTISKHEVFERCPVIVFHRQIVVDFRELHDADPEIMSYAFGWENGQMVIALGLGSMYNHANNGDGRNAGFRNRYDESYPAIEFYAMSDISPGDEILTHYGGRGGRGTDMFFTSYGDHHFDTIISKRERAKVRSGE